MIIKKAPICLAIILLLVTITSGSAYADQTALGKAAEKEGRLRQALTHYVEALKINEGDQQLREKIIKLAKKIQPPPEVSDTALRYMGRGRAAMEIAKEPADFGYAVTEFNKAVQEAPWLADGYYNLGVAQESAGHFDDAIRSFKLYLLAAPSAADAQEVRTRIFGLEYKSERHSKDKIEKERKLREERRVGQALEGIWRQYDPYTKTGRHYDDHLHYQIYVTGNDMTLKQVVDMQLGEYSVGHTFGPWSYKLDGHRLLSKDDDEYELSYDLKELIHIVSYEGKVRRTTFHKCRDFRLSSCGK